MPSLFLLWPIDQIKYTIIILSKIMSIGIRASAKLELLLNIFSTILVNSRVFEYLILPMSIYVYTSYPSNVSNPS